MTKEQPAFLVIDDSVTIRKMIISALRPLHPQYGEASNGLEGIEQLILRRYDLIFLDLNMPDMHGLEFLQFLRSHAAFERIPVVVVTTRSSDDTRQQMLSAGADGFLIKPFTPEELLQTAQSFIES